MKVTIIAFKLVIDVNFVHFGLVSYSDFKYFNLKGSKTVFQTFKNGLKKGVNFLKFSKLFLVDTHAKNIFKHMFLDQIFFLDMISEAVDANFS